MSNVLVVLGSNRPTRIADTIASYVTKEIEGRDGMTVTVADLRELAMPFFNNVTSPLDPAYEITEPSVLEWQKLVVDADSIVFVTSENNHTMAAIQSNAIDSLGAEWTDKAVTAVGYGWGGASLALASFREKMTHLKSDLKKDEAHLAFMKDINLDGSVINEETVASEIRAMVDQLV